MYTVKHGGDIHRGDLVAIANGNDIYLGIYFGQGRGGTFQYFYPPAVSNSRDYFEEHKKTKEANGLPIRPWSIKWIRKDYLQTPRDSRIMKINRDNITDQATIENIIKAKEILQEFNITVNY